MTGRGEELLGILWFAFLVAGCGGDSSAGKHVNLEDSADAEVDGDVQDTGTELSDTVNPTDSTLPDSTTEVVNDTTAPTCVTAGAFGCGCTANSDCSDGLCIEGPDGKVCTRTCAESCPGGYDCLQTTVGGSDPVSLCVPRHVSLCRPCDARADCRIGGDSSAYCLAGANPADGSFCATSCTSTPCPDGYTCEDRPTGDGTTAKLCVPDAGMCECRPSWAALGLETACARTNGVGTCGGIRTCGAAGLTACSAATAAAETCNDEDDDCDGTTDNVAPTPCDLATAGITTTCTGVTVCDVGQTTCVGRAPSIEICNGTDDDCDGNTDDAFGNCLDSGCVAAGAGYVQNGAPGCGDGQCTYENPTPCGYFTCTGGGAAGDTCAATCDDDSRCIANAACQDHTCVCRTGYAGAACESCAVGYQDRNGDHTCLPACAILPCVQGACDDASGTAVCTCTEGHVGAACDACDAPDFTDPEGDTLCERRGPVLLGNPPAAIARVGKVYRYKLVASQTGFLADDHFVYSLPAGPDTMTLAADGTIVWTPATDDQTWNEDPALSTSVTLTVRATAPDGQFAEHTVDLEVLPAVFVDGLHPAAGRAGGNEPVLVYGRGFVGPAGSIGVDFGDLPAASVTVIDPYTLSVTTPAAPAMTRPLVIVLDGDPDVSLLPGFTHLPVIAFTSTTALAMNSNLTISGEGFDPSEVTANIAALPSRGLTERRLRATAEPDQAEAEFALGISLSESTFATGSVAVIVNGLRSNALPLTITDSPVPSRLAVTSTDAPHAALTTMKLRGAGFAGLTSATLTVAFSGADGPLPATVTAVNAAGTEVSVTVPAGAITGPVTLSAEGHLSAESFVPVEIPGTTPGLRISDLTPELGAPGEALILRGTGFVDAMPSAHTVTLDGTPARVLSAEATRLVIEVPAGLSLGPARVAVTVGAQTDSARLFSVSAPFRRIAGGGPGLAIPNSTSPFATPVTVASVAYDAAGLVLLSDGQRLRALNTTAASIIAFGQTIAPGTLAVLADEAPGAMAIRPLGGDLFFAQRNAIFRMRRSDGAISQYAGQLDEGNSGDGGHRLDATFNLPLVLDFTEGSVLLIADYNNGGIRAINTTGSATTRWGMTLAPDIVQTVEFWGPQSTPGMAIAADDSFYVATFAQVFKVAANRLPKTDPLFVGRTLVGGALVAGADPGSGCPATSVTLRTNNHLAIDRQTGDLYLGSRHGIVRRIVAAGGEDDTSVDAADCVEDYAGMPLTGAGVANPGESGDDGPANAARIALFPRPWMGADGALLISGNGFLREVAPAADPADRIITKLAGAMPLSPEGVDALDLANVGVAGAVVVDATHDRYIYFFGSRIVGQSRTTGLISVLAGTGLDGNVIAPDANAVDSDLSVLRGFDLRDGRHLVILESTMPRVSSVDLEAGTISVLAGDGRAATAAEGLLAGPANLARVDINTGRPKATVGPDGLIYIGNGNLVRVINPTDAALTTFGITIPAGHIDHLPTTLASNTSRIAFDPSGNLYVASLAANRLTRLRPAAPTTVERIINGDTNLYGYPPAGRLSDLRVVGITDITFLPSGDLLIAVLATNVLIYVRAHPDGTIDGDCLCASILGTGGAGSPVAGRAVGAQSIGVTMQALDGNTLVFGDSSAMYLMDLP